MKTQRRGTDERIKRQLAQHHDRIVTEALRAIETIVGDRNSLGAAECDLIRGAIAKALYNDINGSD